MTTVSTLESANNIASIPCMGAGACRSSDVVDVCWSAG